jgi:hypothetical protein
MTTFHSAKLKGINANVKSGLITLSVTVDLNDENYGKAGKLKPYLDSKVSAVTIEITPTQPGLDLSTSTKDGKP